MRVTEKLAPAGALAAALMSVLCCLPLSVPAALGLAGLGLFASDHQVWLIAASIVLLIAGAVQIVRAPSCRRRSRTSIILLCIAAAALCAVIFLPQTLAGFLADRLP